LADDEYEPERNDYNYIENWNGQAHMLCEPKQRIGMLGACFFIGVLVASVIVPVGYLSDIFGRKWLFIGTLVVLIIAQTGFILSQNLD
jgi:MFS family permease